MWVAVQAVQKYTHYCPVLSQIVIIESNRQKPEISSTCRAYIHISIARHQARPTISEVLRALVLQRVVRRTSTRDVQIVR